MAARARPYRTEEMDDSLKIIQALRLRVAVLEDELMRILGSRSKVVGQVRACLCRGRAGGGEQRDSRSPVIHQQYVPPPSGDKQCTHLPSPKPNPAYTRKYQPAHLLSLGDKPHWRLLEVDGGCWRLLEVDGDCWRLLEVVGGCWRLLEVVGG